MKPILSSLIFFSFIASSKVRGAGGVEEQGSKGGTSVNKRKPPAQGWIWHEDGTVELVAYNPDRTGDRRTENNHRGCQ